MKILLVLCFAVASFAGIASADTVVVSHHHRHHYTSHHYHHRHHVAVVHEG